MAMQVTVKQKIEKDQKLEAIIRQMKEGISKTFQASFLEYTGLLAEAANNKDHSKILAEAQKIVDQEILVINEGFSKIETLLTNYVSSSQIELSKLQALRVRQEKMLADVEEALTKHYWG